MGMPNKNVTITGDLTKQLLGLTDQQIQYFSNNNLKSKVGIHQQMCAAFESLSASAKTAGIDLKIASGFRTFERQLHIWNNKFNGNTAIKNANSKTVEITHLSDWQIVEAILLYSALPGASRHHWGCDIDVYAPNLLSANESLQLEPWEYQQSGPMEKLSTWLNKNASKFGFYLPYDCFRGGVAEEPWHLSFAPLATQYQTIFTLESLSACLLTTEIAGKETIIANLPKIAERYINNVNTPQ
jgi:LAS superfamily LD-carboxypeptidase LdcB